MVSLLRRMTKLRALLAIRVGPGAAILPPEVTRIHMDFAFKMNDGHLGPRKFWRNILPRLKYYNPAIPMTLNRTTDQLGPAQMTIHFTDPTSAANTPPAISSTTSNQSSTAPVAKSTPIAPTERTTTMNMKNRHETEILSQLLSITKAVVVEPKEEDLEALKDLEKQRQQSQIDAQRTQKVVDLKKRKEAMLKQAREQIEVAKDS